MRPYIIVVRFEKMADSKKPEVIVTLIAAMT